MIDQYLCITLVEILKSEKIIGVTLKIRRLSPWHQRWQLYNTAPTVQTPVFSFFIVIVKITLYLLH